MRETHKRDILNGTENKIVVADYGSPGFSLNGSGVHDNKWIVTI
jgi:hypothetical protein